VVSFLKRGGWERLKKYYINTARISPMRIYMEKKKEGGYE